MTEERIEAARAAKRAGPVFLEYGFRPFFLGAGIQAVVAMTAWIGWMFLQGMDISPQELSIAVPPHVWHAHEMIFGYALAVVAGFFLTAVPNWTGRQPVRGSLLGTLFAAWLVARLTSWLGGYLPPLAVALPELAFIGMLSVLVGQALLAGWSRRNILFLPVLASLFVASVMYHAGAVYPAHILGLDTILVLVTVIGGRVVPAFTTNALRRDGTSPLPRAADKRDAAAILSVVAVAVADMAAPGSDLAGAIAIAAGLLAGLRLIGWRGTKVMDAPILWILHLGYSWLALGLALKGFAILTGMISETAAIHALTIGAVGSMTMGVMSRAALGHTGRALKVSRGITVTYLLISLAAVTRIAGVVLPAQLQDEAMLLAGSFWIAAFMIFSIGYWPILTRPRVSLAAGD